MGKEEINQKDIMTHLDSTTKQYSKCISFARVRLPGAAALHASEALLAAVNSSLSDD